MFGQYQPYQQPMTIPSYQQYAQNAIRQEIIKVNGENGARAYNIAPNSSVLLLDEQNPIVWLKQTDGAGYPTITPYSITPFQPEPTPDMRSLEHRIEKLEEIINGKSDITSN